MEKLWRVIADGPGTILLTILLLITIYLTFFTDVFNHVSH